MLPVLPLLPAGGLLYAAYPLPAASRDLLRSVAYSHGAARPLGIRRSDRPQKDRSAPQPPGRSPASRNAAGTLPRLGNAGGARRLCENQRVVREPPMRGRWSPVSTGPRGSPHRRFAHYHPDRMNWIWELWTNFQKLQKNFQKLLTSPWANRSIPRRYSGARDT